MRGWGPNVLNPEKASFVFQAYPRGFFLMLFLYFFLEALKFI